MKKKDLCPLNNPYLNTFISKYGAAQKNEGSG